MLKRVSFLLGLILLICLPGRAYAQQPVVIDTLEVALWPEYDAPSMLVIYRVTLDGAVSLPANLTLTIPADAELNAVAVSGTDGELLNADYERRESGDQATINVTVESAYFQFEYYDPNLQKEGTARHFEYTWDGGYAVNQFVVEVQQPFGASDVQSVPALGAGQLRNDGLTYYRGEIGALAAGQAFELSLDYTKQSDNLTAGPAQSAPVAEPQPVEETAPLDWVGILPWVGVAIGLGIVAFGSFRFWQASREEANARRSKSTRRGRRTKASGGSGKVVFCHECGTQSQPGDRFCRNCGVRLRN